MKIKIQVAEQYGSRSAEVSMNKIRCRNGPVSLNMKVFS